VWQGSTVRFRFSGGRVGFALSSAYGQPFFTATVDGKVFPLIQPESLGARYYIFNEDFGPGEHEVCLFKRSEAIFSNIVFDGVVLGPGCALLPPHARRPRRIEFYGDSITSGACNEDPGDDQWENYSTHNNYLAYGAITARELGLDYVCTSVSGTGICHSFNPIFIREIWDKVYPDKDRAAYDFSGQPEPDIIAVNIGQNDYGFSNQNGLPFPAGFGPGYLELLRAIRGKNPNAKIVCLIGGMDAWEGSAALRETWKDAVAELEAADPKISHYVFKSRSPGHPRLPAQAELARELVAFLKENIV
jgi:hypothetical protein